MNKARHPDSDEEMTLRKLKRLAPRARVAFALAVATRLFPRYHAFHIKTGRGDSSLLKSLIEKLWLEAASPGQMKLDDLETSAAQTMSLIPSEEEGWDQETQAFAEDAASALAYAFRAALTGNPQEALWATRCALETIEFFLDQQSIESISNEFFLIRAELDRQGRDFHDLESWERQDFDFEILREVRARSERDAPLVLI